MTHRADDGSDSVANQELHAAGGSIYHEALPVWDKDADGPDGPPTVDPDGSAWEPADTGDNWEEQFVADPDAAAEATRERMAEQFEHEKAEADTPADPPPATS